jgi:hypothetical protein
VSATAPDAEPLTAEEVDQLPDGTSIIVTWSGGNGPHRYVLHVDRWGRRYAAVVPEHDPTGAFRTYNPLVGVGAWPRTRVWRVPT